MTFFGSGNRFHMKNMKMKKSMNMNYNFSKSSILKLSDFLRVIMILLSCAFDFSQNKV